MLNAKIKAVRIYLVTVCKSGFITFYKKGIRIFQEVQKIQAGIIHNLTFPTQLFSFSLHSFLLSLCICIFVVVLIACAFHVLVKS